MYVACKKGHIKLVKKLLEDERICINQYEIYSKKKRNQNHQLMKFSPFYAASAYNHEEICLLLLSHPKFTFNSNEVCITLKNEKILLKFKILDIFFNIESTYDIN